MLGACWVNLTRYYCKWLHRRQGKQLSEKGLRRACMLQTPHHPVSYRCLQPAQKKWVG